MNNLIYLDRNILATTLLSGIVPKKLEISTSHMGLPWGHGGALLAHSPPISDIRLQIPA